MNKNNLLDKQSNFLLYTGNDGKVNIDVFLKDETVCRKLKNMKADINKKEAINFNNLVETIQKINTEFSIQAKTAVNVSLILRNWFIGG